MRKPVPNHEIESSHDARQVLTLQYLRGVAAMAVAIYHVQLGLHHFGGKPTQSTSQFGAAGVDLFFVISGFIMMYISAAKRPRPAKFLQSRLLRVVPVYSIVTIAMFLMPLVSKTIGWSSTLNPLQLVTSLLCIGVTSSDASGSLLVYPVYRAGWTINYEIFFYCVFAIGLCARKNLHCAAITCTTIVGLVLLGYARFLPGGVAGFYTAPILLEFTFGIAVALWYLRGRLLPRWVGALLVISGAMGLYLAAEAPQLDFIRGVPAMAIVAGALCLESLARLYPSRVLKLLGDASYSIYLTHLFTVPALDAVLHRILPTIEGFMAAIYIVAGITIAALGGIAFFYLVERPMHNWARMMVQGNRVLAR